MRPESNLLADQQAMTKLPSVFLAVFIFVGCTGYSVTGGPGPLVHEPLSVEVSPKFKPGQLHDITVYPLSAGATYHLDEGVGSQLDAALVSALANTTAVNVLNVSAPELIAPALAKVAQMHSTERQKALAFGSAVHAQAVLFGVVTRFRDSSGGRMGANEPASIDFRLWLVDARTKEELWSAVYEKSEQPLTIILFRMPQELHGGVAYESAMQMAKEGFSAAARALENLRHGAE